MSVSFWWMSSSMRPVRDPILGVEVAGSNNGEVRGAGQVVQNWLTGISNLTRLSKLG